MLKRIPLHLVTRNPDQPRQHFDARALAELADSIAANGLMQPITVRPIPETPEGHRYMVICGERRFRAHLLLAERGALDAVLAHVRKMDDSQMHIEAILENLQREGISHLDEAIAFQRAIDEHGFTVETLAERLGIRQPWRIERRLRLLGLAPEMQALYRHGTVITEVHGQHMAGLSLNGQREFVSLIKRGLVPNDAAARAAADAIRHKEATVDLPLGEPEARRKPRASLRTVEERIDALGGQLQPFFKDGQWTAPDNIDVAEAERCREKLRLLKQHIVHMERELARAASVTAVAE